MSDFRESRRPGGRSSAHSAVPVSVEELTFALHLFQAAASGRMPVQVEPLEDELFDDDDADEVTLAVHGSPLHRGMIAIMEHFGDDRRKLVSLALRIRALSQVLSDAEAREWVFDDPEDPGSSLVHPALFEAAAKAPLEEEGLSFDTEKFFDGVEQIAGDLD